MASKRPSTAEGSSGGISFISPWAVGADVTASCSVLVNEPPPDSPLVHIKAPEPADRRRSIATACFRPRGSDMSREELGKLPERGLSSPTLPGREALFADHLSAILNHSLSLCSASDDDESPLVAPVEPLSPPLTPGCSPKSSYDLDHAPFSPPLSGSGAPRQRIQRLPSLPSISTTDRRRLIEALQGWSFNAHELDDDELWECAAIMFECALTMEGVEPCVCVTKIRSLLIALRAAYHSRNAYHNFMHATDVLQALYSFLVAFGVAPPLSTLNKGEGVWKRKPEVDAPGGLGELLRPMDVFALLIAAIGHDVGHPGLSNAYMVNARTPVAQVYGGKSCLENFHSITLVQMLKRNGFGHLTESSAQGVESDFRKVLTASVLATDMSSHFPIVAKLQDAARRFSSGQRTPDQAQEDRLLLCGCLMKCADISNPSRPHNVARTWSTRLLEEWAEQARIEAEFKLPISVVTLNPAEKRAQAKSQVGFINLFTQPLFDAMTVACPAFAPFADYCREGRRTWEQVVLSITDSQPPSPEASLPSPPRLRLSASFGAGLNSRRQAPPKPLALESERKGSIDSSSTASSRSPFSPLFARLGVGRTHSSSTLMTEADETETAVSPFPRAEEAMGECDGTCVNVTARCAVCMQREQKSRSTPTIMLDGFERDWPPPVFCPTTNIPALC